MREHERTVPAPDAMAPKRRVAPIGLALLVAIGIVAAVFSRIDLHTDMLDFLPAGQTRATRLLLDQVRSGTAATLILIGLEGAAPDRLAEASRSITATLDRSGLFAFVRNGESIDSAAETFLFDHRYLLSPVTDPDAFSVASLHRDFAELLDTLATSAAPLVERYAFADPPGAFLTLLRSMIGDSKVQTRQGVWFAADRERALIVAKTRAAGVDVNAQRRVRDAIEAAFAQARPPGARLLLAGPAIFTLEAAQAIRADLRLISIVSTILIVALLVWRFRSPWVIAAASVPILLSVAAAVLAVQLVDGFVHGVTLGFGLTMLGVSIDYPVLLIGHRRIGEALPATMRRIGKALTLTVIAGVLGLTGMLFSRFPGLSQLGLFSAVGLATAALATRYVLGPLIVLADIAPASTGAPRWLLRLESLRRHRVWFLLLPAAAFVWLVAIGGPRWERELSRLSPVPQAEQDLDAALRAEVGAPEVGQLMLVTGSSAEAVLEREEALAPVLDRLVGQGMLSGADLASRILPSIRTQRARQAALPATAELAARVQQAASGLPFRDNAFDGFETAVAAERSMAPLSPADITNPLIAARLQPLLFDRGGVWYGLIAPRGVRDSVGIARALQHEANVTLIDIKGETDRMVAAYTGQALHWLGIGAAAASLALVVGLGVRRLPLVLGPIAIAIVLTLAVLALAGIRLSLFHVVALQLMVGVGLDYALFFARRGLDGDERARTFRTLVTCNAMTLLTFGLLAFCRTPLLRGIGVTVAVGVLAAILYAFLFAGPRPDEVADAHRDAH